MTKIKFIYYIQAYLRYILPAGGFEGRIKKLSKKLPADELQYVE